MKYINYFESKRVFIDIIVEHDIKKLIKLLNNNKISPSDRIKNINGLIFGSCETLAFKAVLDNINVDKANWTLFMIASYIGSIEIIEILMKFADNKILEETDQGLTPLMLATINRKMNAIEKLIDLGANVSHQKNGKDFYDIADQDIKNKILEIVGNKKNIPYFADVKKYNL
jgi:ankyrin repeat protein